MKALQIQIQQEKENVAAFHRKLLPLLEVEETPRTLISNFIATTDTHTYMDNSFQ